MTKKSRLNLIKAIFWLRERMEYRQNTNTVYWNLWFEDLDSEVAIQQDIDATVNRTPDWTGEITVETFDHRQMDITRKGLEAVEAEALLKKEQALIFKQQFESDVIYQTEVDRLLAIEEIRAMEELEELQARQWEELERVQAGLPTKEPTTKELLAIKSALRRAKPIIRNA